MSSGSMLRAKKLKGSAIIRAAAAHNKRTIQAELGADCHIDTSRSHLNERLAGVADPEGIAARARELRAGAGIGKLRKDAVRAIEFVVSLAPEHGIDDRAFFVACVAWLASRFGGGDNILSADIHRDEAAPHLHVLLLPLIGGRMVGSDALGGRAQLAALHSEFHAQVAANFGLKRPPARLQGSTKAAGVSAVLGHLKRTADAAMRSAVWGELRDCIESNPGPFMAALGMAAPQAKPKVLRSMTAIFTGKGKGSAAPKQEQPYRVLRAANE